MNSLLGFNFTDNELVYKEVDYDTLFKKIQLDKLTNFSAKTYEAQEIANNLIYQHHAESIYFPTWFLLSHGSDDRSHLNKSSLENKYQSSTLPQKYEHIIQRSSCTSSTIYDFRYQQVQSIHKQLLQDYQLYGQQAADEFVENQRKKIISLFDLASTCDQNQIIFTPSGTDVEYLLTWLGYIHFKKYINQTGPAKLRVIISANNEVGSGTIDASSWKRFNKNDAYGTRQELIDYRPKDITISHNTIDARDKFGNCIKESEIETKILRILTETVSNNEVSILHFVPNSKTGLSQPSFKFIKFLQKKFPANLVVVADCAQLRLKPQALKLLLENQISISITGSKFIGAAPFCGALLLAKNHQEILLNNKYSLPNEALNYFDKYSVPKNLSFMLPKSNWTNWGLIIRWQQAICILEDYKKIPENFIELILKHWNNNIVNLLTTNADLVSIEETTYNQEDISIFYKFNSIITFTINRLEFLSGKDIDELYKFLNLANTETNYKIQIGRAIDLSHNANTRWAIRLALGAENIIRSHQTFLKLGIQKAIEDLLEEDKNIILKIRQFIKEKYEC